MIVLVSDEVREAEQVGEPGTLPKLTATAEPARELRAERFNRPAADGCSRAMARVIIHVP